MASLGVYTEYGRTGICRQQQQANGFPCDTLSEEWDKQPHEYRHINFQIIYGDIREVVKKLTSEYYSKLTSEIKQELQESRKWHIQYKKIFGAV